VETARVDPDEPSTREQASADPSRVGGTRGLFVNANWPSRCPPSAWRLECLGSKVKRRSPDFGATFSRLIEPAGRREDMP
jgi:hypothetical protein